MKHELVLVPLGPFVHRCHQVEADEDVLERLHVRVPANGMQRRLRRMRGGAGRVPAADEVHRQLGGVFGSRSAVAVFQAATDLQLGPGAALGGTR